MSDILSQIITDGTVYRYWYMGAAQAKATQLTQAGIKYDWLYDGVKQYVR